MFAHCLPTKLYMFGASIQCIDYMNKYIFIDLSMFFIKEESGLILKLRKTITR